MIHGRRMIFMVLPLLFVPVVYGMSSTPDACALPPDPNWESSDNCTPSVVQPPEGDPILTSTCCWHEYDPNSNKYVKKCQICEKNPTTGKWGDCGAVFTSMTSDLPQLEQVPTTPPPMFGLGQNLPQDLPTLEESPPRFGQNLPQDLPTLQETPPSPLPPTPPPPPPPTGPTVFPEDSEVLEEPAIEEQDEPPSPEPEQPSADDDSEGNN